MLEETIKAIRKSYKREIERNRKESWKKLVEDEGAWGTPYKVIMQNKKTQS